ncbi:hypothetical protein FQZ97_538080 [compost metagenome]
MQRQPARGHFARNGLQCGLPLAHDAQLSERIATGRCQRGGRGEQAGQAVDGRVDRVAESLDQPRAQRARRSHGDLLAQHRAHRELEAVDRAGHAQPVAVRKGGMQRGVDGHRLRVEVEQRACAADDDRQHRGQRIAHGQQHLLALEVEAQLQPAGVRLRAMLHAQGSRQPHIGRRAALGGFLAVGGVHGFDAAQRAPCEEAEHGVRVVGRAKTQPHLDGLAFAALGAARAAQRARVEPVVLHEGRVEAPHAREAAGQRHLRHRQARVGDELLGGQQAARLQVLQRRHAELRLEDAPQVAVAHAQAGRDLRRAGAFLGPGIGLVDQARRLQCQDARGIFGRPTGRARRQLGPAAQAGPKACGLGLGRVAEEAAVLAPRQLHAAHRPAVDAGGGHGREERAVEARVVRLHRQVAGVALEHFGGGVGGRHGEMIRFRLVSTGRFRTSMSTTRCLQCPTPNQQ